MERVKEVERIEQEIRMWRQNQEKHASDISFWHYAQAQIDRLEDKLDKVTRLENWHEYL